MSFEDVVLKGLAPDGGLFIPEELPSLPSDWQTAWASLSFQDLAVRIFSLYISPAEIPPADLADIVRRSYSTFRAHDVTPVITLDERRNLHLLELFHGPTFAFKDVALQFLGNLFEYFLVRRNASLAPTKRQHLTVVGATSGDTGSAAIYGLRGKQDVSVFIMHPKGKISPVQEAQMTTVLDANVHNIAVDGTFDDCQDFVKALFADPDINSTHRLAAVNSINWARILAQITYYFHAHMLLVRDGRLRPTDAVRFVVPTGNFGDVLAGYFAKRMGLPIAKLVVATNANDILDRFWRSGRYEKQPAHGADAHGGLEADGVAAHEDGVKETLSPAMDILVSSNFERLLWFLAHQVHAADAVRERRENAGKLVRDWLSQLKSSGGFAVDKDILAAAQADFESERVSDAETLSQIAATYAQRDSPAGAAGSAHGTTGTTLRGGYIIDPHTAIGVAAALRSIQRQGATQHIALATAHPAKFSSAVELALQDEKDFQFEALLPEQLRGMEKLERRCVDARRSDGFEGIRTLIRGRVPASGS